MVMIIIMIIMVLVLVMMMMMVIELIRLASMTKKMIKTIRLFLITTIVKFILLVYFSSKCNPFRGPEERMIIVAE